MDGNESRIRIPIATSTATANTFVVSGFIIPGNPPMPCPELLTEDEAIRYLRLDTVDIDNPSETLARYRSNGTLRGTQVSKRILYRRVELERFLDRQTEANPR